MNIPREVLLSDISNAINYAINEKYPSLPLEDRELQPLYDYVTRHNPQIANNYFNNLLRECPDKSIEELQDIVNTMPAGLYRAEIRAILKNKLNNNAS